MPAGAKHEDTQHSGHPDERDGRATRGAAPPTPWQARPCSLGPQGWGHALGG